MKKTILIILFLIGLSFLAWNSYQGPNRGELGQALKTTEVTKTACYQRIIERAQEQPDFKEYEFSGGETALDLLKRTTEVETKGEGTNAFVIKINNRAADSKKKEFWAFYVNGQPASVGAGSYKLKSGDKIDWKIETY